jgi:hypothetical protein
MVETVNAAVETAITPAEVIRDPFSIETFKPAIKADAGNELCACVCACACV